MMLNKHNAPPTLGCMVQVFGLAQLLLLNGMRGQTFSRTDDDRWAVKLQNGDSYLLTQDNMQTLSPPPTDRKYSASTNTRASIPALIDTDDSTSKSSGYKIVETTREDELSGERKAVMENKSNLQRWQNNTPDYKSHNPSASSSTYEPASPNTLALPPKPTNILDDMTEPTAHAFDHTPTSLTTPLKMSGAQETNRSCTNCPRSRHRYYYNSAPGT